jgi:hypothetical protein
MLPLDPHEALSGANNREDVIIHTLGQLACI